VSVHPPFGPLPAGHLIHKPLGSCLAYRFCVRGRVGPPSIWGATTGRAVRCRAGTSGHAITFFRDLNKYELFGRLCCLSTLCLNTNGHGSRCVLQSISTSAFVESMYCPGCVWFVCGLLTHVWIFIVFRGSQLVPRGCSVSQNIMVQIFKPSHFFFLIF